MIPKERRNSIVELLNQQGYISVEELAKKLYVSPATVRRDLAELERDGFLKRTHGGASFIPIDHISTSIDYRTKWNVEEKMRIGKKAAELVDDGMNIFIDSSSTTILFSKELVKKKDLHVLTNNISIAQILSANQTHHVEVTCGTYDCKHGAIFGSDTAGYIRQRYADIFFVSASGLNINGVTTKEKNDIASKQAFQQSSNLIVLLMDHTKFNEINYYLVFQWNDIDVLITDQPLPTDLQKICQKHQIHMIIA